MPSKATKEQAYKGAGSGSMSAPCCDGSPGPTAFLDACERLAKEHPDWSLARREQRSMVEIYFVKEKP